MANNWRCTICLVFFALTLKELVRHISIMHANQPNFRVVCGVNNCPQQYQKMNSLRYHIRHQHQLEWNSDNCHQQPPVVFQEQNAGQEGEDQAAMNESDDNVDDGLGDETTSVQDHDLQQPVSVCSLFFPVTRSANLSYLSSERPQCSFIVLFLYLDFVYQQEVDPCEEYEIHQGAEETGEIDLENCAAQYLMKIQTGTKMTQVK